MSKYKPVTSIFIWLISTFTNKKHLLKKSLWYVCHYYLVDIEELPFFQKGMIQFNCDHTVELYESCFFFLYILDVVPCESSTGTAQQYAVCGMNFCEFCASFNSQIACIKYILSLSFFLIEYLNSTCLNNCGACKYVF